MAPKKASKATAKQDDSKMPSRAKQDPDKDIEEEEEEEEVAGEEEEEIVAEEDDGQKNDEKLKEAEAEAEADGGKNGQSASHAGQKRKEPPTSTAKSKEPEAKTRRQGSRSLAKNQDNAATPKQLLNFLLSSAALPYCFPPDELEDAKKSKTYKSCSLTSPTSFTAFEHLICAHLLSKPLSHRLGMRSIRTLLNEPFSLSSAETIVSAGEKRVWEALETARTQHRQKTAAYIFGMAQSYADADTLFQLAEEANNDGAPGVIEHIKATVPGLGVTGAEIFCRRIQCVDGWGDALWPYADGKSIDALREIGVPVRDAEGLQSAIEREVNWDLVGDMGLHERDLSKAQLVGEQEETQVQAEFVVVLERAVGCVLEGNVQALRKAAADT